MRQELRNIDFLFKNSRKSKLTFLQKPRYLFSIVEKIKINFFLQNPRHFFSILGKSLKHNFFKDDLVIFRPQVRR